MSAIAARLRDAVDAVQAPRPMHPVARFRPHELTRLLHVRFGRQLPDDEAGARLRDRMLDTLALLGDVGRQRAEDFLIRYCRWMSPSDRVTAIDAAFHFRRLWSAEEIGNNLGVTAVEHRNARLSTVRVAGMTDDMMAAKRKVSERDRKQRERDRARLHGGPKLSKVDLRLDAILTLLKPSDCWVPISALTALLKQKKSFHFTSVLKEKTQLASAVDYAIKRGVEKGQLERRIAPGPKFSVAEIRRFSK